MNFPTPKLNDFFETSKPITGILSIFGDLGVGKTTLALQIAISAATKGKVVYFYSKPNFPYEKVGKLLKDYPSQILNNVIFISILNFTDLIPTVENLELLILNSLKENKLSINLILIDSLTDLYRLELNKDKKKKNVHLNYQLNHILANLCYINELFGSEILIVNELSRKSYENSTKEMQSGGKVMDYWVRNSVKISRTKKLNVRKFKTTKELETSSLKFLSELSEHGFG
jgi:RecA/RadA recombinase